MSAANRSSAPIRFSSPSPRASMFHDSAGEARHESLRRCSVRLALLRWNRSDGSCPSRVRHPRQDHARLGAPVTYSLCAAAASRVTAHHHGDVARGRPLSSLGSSVLRREDRVQDRDVRDPGRERLSGTRRSEASCRCGGYCDLRDVSWTTCTPPRPANRAAFPPLEPEALTLVLPWSDRAMGPLCRGGWWGW
jgi:hypothetical protein